MFRTRSMCFRETLLDTSMQMVLLASSDRLAAAVGLAGLELRWHARMLDDAESIPGGCVANVLDHDRRHRLQRLRELVHGLCRRKCGRHERVCRGGLRGGRLCGITGAHGADERWRGGGVVRGVQTPKLSYRNKKTYMDTAVYSTQMHAQRQHTRQHTETGLSPLLHKLQCTQPHTETELETKE